MSNINKTSISGEQGRKAQELSLAEMAMVSAGGEIHYWHGGIHHYYNGKYWSCLSPAKPNRHSLAKNSNKDS